MRPTKGRHTILYMLFVGVELVVFGEGEFVVPFSDCSSQGTRYKVAAP
jgi:hypothetical protein